MKISNTAILLIEFQNEFCSEEGTLNEIVKDEIERLGTIENTVDLVEQSREKGVQIIHVPIQFSEDYREVPFQARGVLKNVKEAEAFKMGTDGAEIIGDLKPEPGDITLSGKRTISAFPTTNLDFVLRNSGIRNVALAGFLTNVCVESTARSAYDKGYRVALLRDCVASSSKEAQEATETVISENFGEVISHEEFLERLD